MALRTQWLSRLLSSFVWICTLTLQQQHARAFAPQHWTLIRAPRASSCRVTDPRRTIRRTTTVGLSGNLDDDVTTSWSKDDTLFLQRDQKKQEDLEQDAARKKRWQSQEQFMEAQGATYAILWVRAGEYFVVAKDFTTTERRNATRIVRRDNKTFASEVRLLQIYADSAGPVPTAARSFQEQVVPAHASNLLHPPTIEAPLISKVRSDLAEEFSVKNFHFIPLTDGSKLLSIFGAGMYETTSFKQWAKASADVLSDTRRWDGASAVLEYGVPSEPEVLSVKLLSLLIQEISLVKTFGAFMVLSLEIVSTLRVIIFVEGPTGLMSGVRRSALAVVEGTMASDKKSAQAQLSSVGTSSKEYRLFRITKFVLKPVVVVIATMTYAVEGYNNWKERPRQSKIQMDED